MVLAGQHGDQVLPVAEGQHSHLGTHHALLDDHGGAGGTEFVVLHHGTHGLLGLLHSGGHHHALAQGKAVRLHHDGGPLRPDIGQGSIPIGESFVFGGGDVVLLHQLFGESLAGLNDSGVGPGAEGGDPRRLQGVHHAQGQGVVRGHHDEVHRVLLGPGHHGLHVRGLDGHALGHLGDAPVARGAVQLGHLGTLSQLPADGVLPPASADD